MAELIRAEARATLWRWREVIAGGGLCALGSQGALSYGLMVWAGWLCILLGVAAIITGIPRALFRGSADGPGIVELDEGQVRYMGPFSGADMSLDTVMVIAMDGAHAAPRWILTNAFQERITIPTGATGADLLFDAFTALPGFRMERALSALRAPEAAIITIWRRPNAAVDTAGFSPQA